MQNAGQEIEGLQRKIEVQNSLLVQWGLYSAAKNLGHLAYLSLLEEVYTTPKPGLVDRYSNGAHTDMNCRTFERSAAALKPYFETMAMQGIQMADTPEFLFGEIRKTGILAEKAMFDATAGVNTHKGLIFSLGIFCAAAGACLRRYGKIEWEQLIDTELAMVSRTLKNEVEAIADSSMKRNHKVNDTVSHGEENFLRYGKMGVRGEALSGYASVGRISLPVMRKGICEGRDWNLVKLQTLFALMREVEDSNIISRHNPQVLLQVQAAADAFWKAGGAYQKDSIRMLQDMDQAFIRDNISAGGCADLLAVTIFLVNILTNHFADGK